MKESNKNIFFSHNLPVLQLRATVRNSIRKLGLPLNCPFGARRGNSWKGKERAEEGKSCAAIPLDQDCSAPQKR